MNYADLRSYYARAYECIKYTHGPHSREMARLLVDIGIFLKDHDKPLRAERILEQALIMFTGLPGTHSELVKLYHCLSECYYSRGANALGQIFACLVDVTELRLPSRLNKGHRDVAHILNNLGVRAARGGSHQMAEQLYRMAFEIFARTLGTKHDCTKHCAKNLRVLQTRGRWHEEHLQKAG